MALMNDFFSMETGTPGFERDAIGHVGGAVQQIVVQESASAGRRSGG